MSGRTETEPAADRRGWGRALSTAFGTAACAAAAQLGIAYGLGILLWARQFTDRSEATWAANLTWVCWLAGSSVVAGAVLGGRQAWAAGLPRSLLTRLALVLSAALGALAMVPLVAIPARYADVTTPDSPAVTAARLAAIGVLLGVVVSIGVLLGRPMAWNVIVTGGWLWLLALGSVLLALRAGEPPDTTRLAILGTASGWFPVMAPMLLAALVIGAGTAHLAKRDGRHRVSVAVCGAPGPLLVAVAYLIAGPGSRPETGEQFLPYLAAPYAVLTGLLGSLLVAAIESPEHEGAAPPEPDPGAADAPATAPGVLGHSARVVAATAPDPRREATDQGPPGEAVTDADPRYAALDQHATHLLPTVPAPQVPAPMPPGPQATFAAERALTPPVSPGPPSAVQQLGPDARPDPRAEPHPGPRPDPPPSGPRPDPLPDPRPDPHQGSGTGPEQQTAPQPVPERHGWDDDEELWLRQIKGDDDSRALRAVPVPEVDPLRRRRWSLFGDEEEPGTPG